GVAHLTIPLARRGLRVTAVEPNAAMRAHGVKRTADLADVRWQAGTGDATGQPDSAFDLVTFGSSFNVTDRALALKETARILKPGGWFACLWNHRDLDDPLQAAIEGLIKKRIPGYDYGARREDQAPVVAACGLFGKVECFEARVTHKQALADCLEAWGSHATLQRQAGDAFPQVLDDIRLFLDGLKRSEIEVPYITRVWAAPVRKSR
ncbi:MAG: methyltransferase domain-containing protein, partial [Elusimicrobia bacterium]|nr:methyltransferase domain-containing protein [Elusimicrobiota bacterium]